MISVPFCRHCTRRSLQVPCIFTATVEQCFNHIGVSDAAKSCFIGLVCLHEKHLQVLIGDTKYIVLNMTACRTLNAQQAILELHWSPSSPNIVTCSADKTLGYWDAHAGKRKKTFKVQCPPSILLDPTNVFTLRSCPERGCISWIRYGTHILHCSTKIIIEIYAYFYSN